MISDTVFRFVAVMASWVFGLSGTGALGPRLLKLPTCYDAAPGGA